MVSEQVHNAPRYQQDPIRFYSAPVIISDNSDLILVVEQQRNAEPQPTSDEVSRLSTQSTSLNWLIQLNKSDLGDKLANATFGLLFLGLLACLLAVIVMCIEPRVFGVEKDERFLRMLNDEATEEDKKSMLCLACIRREKGI